MECPFQVNDEVVCVSNEMNVDLDGVRRRFQPDTPMPVIGATYKVAMLIPAQHTYLPIGWRVAVELTELRGATALGNPFRYPHCWFRKVEKPKRQSSIEIFREIDRKVFEKVPA